MSVHSRLAQALEDQSGPALRPLPTAVVAMLTDLHAPARLGAHLRAVHDVACQLTAEIARRWPSWSFDPHAVHFGAAVHDIGKVVHLGELSGPGSAHEQAGYDLLLARGIEPALARFARTHASWRSPGIRAEDLLVSLADKIWKAQRNTDLEQTALDLLTAAVQAPDWQAFLDLDDILTRLSQDADARLAHQARHPIQP